MRVNALIIDGLADFKWPDSPDEISKWAGSGTRTMGRLGRSAGVEVLAFVRPISRLGVQLTGINICRGMSGQADWTTPE